VGEVCVLPLGTDHASLGADISHRRIETASNTCVSEILATNKLRQ
jgi:hypothetical protein